MIEDMTSRHRSFYQSAQAIQEAFRLEPKQVHPPDAPDAGNLDSGNLDLIVRLKPDLRDFLALDSASPAFARRLRSDRPRVAGD